MTSTSDPSLPPDRPGAAPQWQAAHDARTASASTLWELGHIAWFQDYWISRNPERSSGQHATLQHPRLASRLTQGDALHDSSQVPHSSRWQLPLPDMATTVQYAQQVLDDSLALLQGSDTARDDALYFYRLVLFHEDMHSEAWIYMAQSLGIEIPHGLLHRGCGAMVASDPDLTSLRLPESLWQSGWQGAGFAFDNELGSHTVDLPACDIDSQAVTWQRYFPFADANGYREQRWWSAATHHRLAHPRYRNYFEPERNDVPAGLRSCKK